MGWDITYHPVKADEVHSIYFQGLTDPNHIDSIIEMFSVDEFYAEQLRMRFEEARGIEEEVPFNKGHAFYTAIILGFLRKHYYIRGGAFSFLTDDAVIATYLGDWKTLIPEDYREKKIENQLTENYCGGVYLPHAALKKLREDYQTIPHVKEKMDEAFSHGRLDIFWKAVDDAIENGLGLIEAAEVVEPNPLNLDASRSLSNLFNCSPDGAILYSEAVATQLNEAIEKQKTESPSPQKGFFSRLFGK